MCIMSAHLTQLNIVHDTIVVLFGSIDGSSSSSSFTFSCQTISAFDFVYIVSSSDNNVYIFSFVQ